MKEVYKLRAEIRKEYLKGDKANHYKIAALEYKADQIETKFYNKLIFQI